MDVKETKMAKIVYACAKFTRLKNRLPQIYCWKERLRTFGVWDYQNGRQNDSPALFRTMEIDYRNTILSSGGGGGGGEISC